MDLLPLAGKPIYFQPFEFKQIAQANIWDEGPFLKEIADHKFALIVWYNPPDWPVIESRYTPAQRDMVLKYYNLYRKAGDIYIYKPGN
jgi:hypothetical protein